MAFSNDADAYLNVIRLVSCRTFGELIGGDGWADRKLVKPFRSISACVADEFIRHTFCIRSQEFIPQRQPFLNIFEVFIIIFGRVRKINRGYHRVCLIEYQGNSKRVSNQFGPMY